MNTSGDNDGVRIIVVTQEVFMTHRNALLTPEGRGRMVDLIVLHGWFYRMVASIRPNLEQMGKAVPCWRIHRRQEFLSPPLFDPDTCPC